MAPRLKLLRVTAVLGRGNLTETLVADVEEVRPGGTSRSAVVKRLHPSLADSKGAVRRIAEEARVLARLSHPRIPAFVGVGDDNGLPFFAQEQVDGIPLPAGLTVSWQETVAILLDIVGALATAHALGVVHRDLSRRNVLLDRHGRVHLIDFGVARADDRPQVTRTGAIIGTPSAMAPEQGLGEAATAAADVWAWGALGYALVTGRHPLGITADDSPVERLRKVRVIQIHPLASRAAPPALEQLLMACLQRAPSRRPPNGNALVEELTRLPVAPVELVVARAHLGRRAADWLAMATSVSGLAGGTATGTATDTVDD
jgi:serine/threonine protein kinase